MELGDDLVSSCIDAEDVLRALGLSAHGGLDEALLRRLLLARRVDAAHCIKSPETAAASAEISEQKQNAQPPAGLRAPPATG